MVNIIDAPHCLLHTPYGNLNILNANRLSFFKNKKMYEKC